MRSHLVADKIARLVLWPEKLPACLEETSFSPYDIHAAIQRAVGLSCYGYAKYGYPTVFYLYVQAQGGLNPRSLISMICHSTKADWPPTNETTNAGCLIRRNLDWGLSRETPMTLGGQDNRSQGAAHDEQYECLMIQHITS